MTDEALRDLVIRHDSDIKLLVNSQEKLVTSQNEMVNEFKELAKKLEDISKYLAKQTIFANKLDQIDREVAESFKRVHRRVDIIDDTQKNENGCNSVRLVTKDIQNLSREVTRLVGVCEGNRLDIERLDREHAKRINPALIRWVAGFVIMYIIGFGSYVVQKLNTLEKTEELNKAEISHIINIHKGNK